MTNISYKSFKLQFIKLRFICLTIMLKALLVIFSAIRSDILQHDERSLVVNWSRINICEKDSSVLVSQITHHCNYISCLIPKRKFLNIRTEMRFKVSQKLNLQRGCAYLPYFGLSAVCDNDIFYFCKTHRARLLKYQKGRDIRYNRYKFVIRLNLTFGSVMWSLFLV